MPPHAPYRPRREFIGLFDDGWVPSAKPSHFFSQGHSDEFLNMLRLRYDEHVAYTDAEFGRLYDSLKESGLLDSTYVIVTSDHGEMFERGIRGHITETLYDPVIRVPLLISAPGQRQRMDVYTPTSGVDLVPTVLDATGQAVPDWCEGEVLPTSDERAASEERSVFSVDVQLNSKQGPWTTGTVTLVKGQYKLVHYFGYDGFEDEYELFDLANDPEEMDNLLDSRASLAADLKHELAEKLLEVNEPYLRG
jgi:choline-sulfatase